ncbi:MAG TPA: hypothetical protein VMW87_17025 [Spirochaetia bacterium]|nr:hypothetical protein [Spirochaetia bacterium]
MPSFGTIPQRTVKRHIYAPAHRAVAGSGPGFTQETETELRMLLDGRLTPSRLNPTIAASHGRISIRSIDYRSLIELVLRSTCATDLGMVVGTGTVQSEKELRSVISAVEWRLFFEPGANARVKVRAESNASRLYHTGILKDAMSEILVAIGCTESPEDESTDHAVTLRLTNNRLQIVLSLSGERLWRRGYRSSLSAVAPLREDLAQAAIRRALRFADMLPMSGGSLSTGFDTVLVPFAGSGTLAFESIIALCDVPPFVFRDNSHTVASSGYAFERFAFGVPPSVAWLKRRLRSRLRDLFSGMEKIRLRLVDSYAPACEASTANWDQFRGRITQAIASSPSGPEGTAPASPEPPIDLECLHEDVLVHDWRSFLAQNGGTVFLPLNPPYGKRIRTSESASIYQRIGRRVDALAADRGAIAHVAKGVPLSGIDDNRRPRVAGFILCPDESSWRAFMRAAPSLRSETSHFMQGGMDIRLCAFRNR